MCGLCALSAPLFSFFIFRLSSVFFLIFYWSSSQTWRSCPGPDKWAHVTGSSCPHGWIYLADVSLKGHTINPKQLCARRYLEDRMRRFLWEVHDTWPNVLTDPRAVQIHHLFFDFGRFHVSIKIQHVVLLIHRRLDVTPKATGKQKPDNRQRKKRRKGKHEELNVKVSASLFYWESGKPSCLTC